MRERRFSAIKLSDQSYAYLDSDYSIEASFKSLEDWYEEVLRNTYREHYGLE